MILIAQTKKLMTSYCTHSEFPPKHPQEFGRSDVAKHAQLLPENTTLFNDFS